MELFESQPAKPHPLRIIKRSQTISGSSSEDQLFNGGVRRISRSSTQSFDQSFNVGSPPFGADRPLTVHKLRKKRPSVLEGFADSSNESSLNAISEMVYNSNEITPTKPDDPDLTPKASKPAPRTSSPGVYLRSQLLDRSSECPEPRLTVPPNIPARRRVKSKNFLMKAIGGRGSLRKLLGPKDISSLTTPNRRVSGRSMVSIATFDTSLAEGMRRPALALRPDITITPEVQSMESGSCTLWVAISITGTLGRADGESASVEGSDGLDTDHGRIHSMRIELFPGHDCLIREIVGNLHELKTIAPGDTILTLAKIRLRRVSLPFSVGSEDLIADLERKLGNTVTTYLNVRITYNHSGFKDTIMQTDATATIKRHDTNSTWIVAPPSNQRLPSNPVIVLIESHFPVEKARQAIRKLAEDRVRIPLAKRPASNGRDALGSGEETFTDDDIPHLSLDPVSENDDPFTGSIAIPQKHETTSSFPEYVYGIDQEMDPARKIWTEMRRTSRGRHHRVSVSASNYEPLSTSLDPMDHVSKWMIKNDIGVQREHLRDVALRNKRSVGQDTLRSMAPSTKRADVGALGLGRNWGWPTWW
ncbi:hypothetical protein BJ878DRAFT_544153 [Calycina marina]|uniref:Uncharacterized protein n=1 Tax=Calycina marina TaxID=1763456 RepID=A0A9P8CDF6_9HELO|nr:hypothetical protein BJ878DRAFT_544153 [Calycina marina]